MLKPIRAEALLEELGDLRHPVQRGDDLLHVRTFGDIEVFFHDQPLIFRYQKTKEMLAYLIDRRGAMVESDTLITILWGGETDRSNYFKQIGKDYDFKGKETLSLVEEQREYKMPIVEDEDGTYIYTDYIFEMFSEICDLRNDLKRGIVDTLFIEDDALIAQVLRDYKRVSGSNAGFIRDSFLHNHPGNYSSGYLYLKTNIVKE